MRNAVGPANLSFMRTTYGVVWREEDERIARGRLELLPRSLRLDGTSGSKPTTREISYDQLAEIRIGRTTGDRLNGRPSLVLERLGAKPVAIATVAEVGGLAEIVERLAALQLGAERERRTAVVVPLREGADVTARNLLADGPPFDLEALGLDRHDVFLTPQEAIFVFECEQGAQGFEALIQDPGLWQAASAWHDLVSGPPRIAEDMFSWARPERAIDTTPLPPRFRE
jgi:hypothetical protein